jgi:hypothetical protein
LFVTSRRDHGRKGDPMQVTFFRSAIVINKVNARWTVGKSRRTVIQILQASRLRCLTRYWLDLSTPSCVSNIQDIMTKRISLAMVRSIAVSSHQSRLSKFGCGIQAKGCDAVEPDNTDSYVNDPGWQTTSAYLSLLLLPFFLIHTLFSR